MKLAMNAQCPICGNPAHFGLMGDSQQVECPRCGHYRLTGTASAILARGQLQIKKPTNASSWIYEAGNPVVDSTTLDWLADVPTPPVGAKALRLLAHFERRDPTPGTVIRFKPEASLELQAVSWAANMDELLFLFQDFLEGAQRAVEQALGESGGGFIGFRITPAGWVLLEDSRKLLGRSADGFIAMPFAEELRPTRDALMSGIDSAGWSPIIINREDFTEEKVDDEIMARIRQCRFVVADFTNQRPNVYFEAGYAEGLGKPIVWSCRRDQIDGLQFDVRQYNFIAWEAGGLGELTERVKNRIGHVLGWGPKFS